MCECSRVYVIVRGLPWFQIYLYMQPDILGYLGDIYKLLYHQPKPKITNIYMAGLVFGIFACSISFQTTTKQVWPHFLKSNLVMCLVLAYLSLALAYVLLGCLEVQVPMPVVQQPWLQEFGVSTPCSPLYPPED